MNTVDDLQAARDCVAAALKAEEQVRSNLAEASVWLALATRQASSDNGGGG